MKTIKLEEMDFWNDREILFQNTKFTIDLGIDKDRQVLYTQIHTEGVNAIHVFAISTKSQYIDDFMEYVNKNNIIETIKCLTKIANFFTIMNDTKLKTSKDVLKMLELELNPAKAILNKLKGVA